jgi:hypothetical protein
MRQSGREQVNEHLQMCKKREAVTSDNSTLIVAESCGKRLTAFDIAADGSLSNRWVWAGLDVGVRIKPILRALPLGVFPAGSTIVKKWARGH